MKYLNRIAVFFVLLMAFALAASVQAADTTDAASSANAKSTGKQISVDKKEKAAARSHLGSTWIDRTWLTLLTDEDGDGFYHHFRFSFDADTSYLTQGLYAKVFMTDGVEEWLIFESGYFTINAQSGTDVYEITTSLNEGYPPGAYDLTLRLYDSVTDELILSWDYLDDSTLANLYLEDAEEDTFYSSTPYVYSFTSELSDDFDGDGFFSRIDLTVDVDAPLSQSNVRIGVELYDPSRGWESLYLSPEIRISGSTTADAEQITLELDSGFPEDHYTLRLTVYESLSRAVLSTESISQSMPLESLDYEASGDSYHRSSSSHGSGGAMGLILLPAALLAWVKRRRYTVL